jgi:hypothetical protein
MKQARISLCLIAVALATRSANSRAQPSPEEEIRLRPGLSLGAAREQYDQAFKREAEFFESAVPHLGDGNVREWNEDQRKKLRALVEQTFQARQELQRAELRELQRRLDAIGRALHDREAHKELIIDTRLNQLISSEAASDGYAEFVEQRVENGEVKTIRRRVPVKGIRSPVPQAPAYKTVREEEYVDENGQVVTRMVPVTIRPTAPVAVPTPVLPQPAVGDEQTPEAPGKRSQVWADEIDIETRERLAQIDFQAAEEEYAALEKELAQLRKLAKEGAAPERQIRSRENEYRQAALALKRAKAKLQGVARQRAELEAAADAAVKQAEAERELAAAKVQTAMAARDAARGEIEKAEADVESAQAKVDYEQKQYARIKALTDAKAVDENLLIERESALDAAKAALLATKASVSTGKANFNESASAIVEAQAGLNIADARLRAAQAQRDRLAHRDEADDKAPAESAPRAKTGEQSK